jgi:hypothetical protein
MSPYFRLKSLTISSSENPSSASISCRREVDLFSEAHTVGFVPLTTRQNVITDPVSVARNGHRKLALLQIARKFFPKLSNADLY